MKTRLIVALLAFLMLVAISKPIAAQWTKGVGIDSVRVMNFASTSTALFAAVDGNSSETKGIYRSTDAGQTWVRVRVEYATAIAATGNKVYASAGVGEAVTMISSADNGATWQPEGLSVTTFPGASLTMTAIAAADSNVFASVMTVYHYPSTKVYRSTNSGATWTQATSHGWTMYSMLAKGDSVWVGRDATEPRISRSTNSGSNWEMSSFFSGNYVGFFDLIESNGVLFVGAGGTPSRMYCSTDGGAVWTALPNALPNTNAIAADNGALFASTYNGEYPQNWTEVYASTNQGESWLSLTANFPVGIYTYALLARDGVLIAATSNGVWRRSVTDVLSTPVTTPAPAAFRLNQNYPNPFNPETIINYELETSSQVSLKVFDVLGREVQTLVNERQSAGKKNVRFNATNLPSGVYFYKLTASGSSSSQSGSFVATRKMILIK